MSPKQKAQLCSYCSKQLHHTLLRGVGTMLDEKLLSISMLSNRSFINLIATLNWALSLRVAGLFTHTVIQINHYSTTYSPWAYFVLLRVRSSLFLVSLTPDDRTISGRAAQPLPFLVSLKLTSSRNNSRHPLPLVSNPFLPDPLANILMFKYPLPHHLGALPLNFFL